MSKYKLPSDEEALIADLRKVYADAQPPAGAAARAADAAQRDGERRSSRSSSRGRTGLGLGGVSLAAAAALVLFAAGVMTDRLVRSDSRGAASRATAVATQPDSARDITFVFAAPKAHDVALVGDFNGWNRRGAKLVRNAAGQWEIHVRMPTGLHMYAFVVDGSTWVADPLAPRGAGDDYGVASSAILVGGSAHPAGAPRS